MFNKRLSRCAIAVTLSLGIVGCTADSGSQDSDSVANTPEAERLTVPATSTTASLPASSTSPSPSTSVIAPPSTVPPTDLRADDVELSALSFCDQLEGSVHLSALTDAFDEFLDDSTAETAIATLRSAADELAGLIASADDLSQSLLDAADALTGLADDGLTETTARNAATALETLGEKVQNQCNFPLA